MGFLNPHYILFNKPFDVAASTMLTYPVLADPESTPNHSDLHQLGRFAHQFAWLKSQRSLVVVEPEYTRRG